MGGAEESGQCIAIAAHANALWREKRRQLEDQIRELEGQHGATGAQRVKQILDEMAIVSYLDEIPLPQVPNTLASELDKDITPVEVLEAIRRLRVGKAPGQDGSGRNSIGFFVNFMEFFLYNRVFSTPLKAMELLLFKVIVESLLL
ncbi:hypothetical protein NDU88_006008 [Pleurodeles waltl]|uniref:Uncharacterized protein n=1 Tax=Pleurodeles waltl TaxID=8319 RepID=A0AAV7NSZ6_PLEWA|nr:hypothetical protein NDU88_006008 [Pleurodeles waltl]